MLSDEQIKEEAKKRKESMSPEKRQEILQILNDKYDIDRLAVKKGLENLTPEENRKFHEVHVKDLDRVYAGDIMDAATEKIVMEKLHLSREEIANMKKNPFKADMYKQILKVVLVALGFVAVAGVSLATGLDMTIPYLGLTGVSGIFAYNFGQKLMNVMRFRSLQKKYNNPNYQEQEIDAEVYRMFDEEVKKERGL